MVYVMRETIDMVHIIDSAVARWDRRREDGNHVRVYRTHTSATIGMIVSHGMDRVVDQYESSAFTSRIKRTSGAQTHVALPSVAR